jgi:coproporphyrinogen III oxidase-like Fe-S oxidoreductase
MQSEDALSPEQRAREALVMGLRLREGVTPAADAVDWAAVERLAEHGLLTHDGQTVRLTEAGFPVLDAILVEIAK